MGAHAPPVIHVGGGSEDDLKGLGLSLHHVDPRGSQGLDLGPQAWW